MLPAHMKELCFVLGTRPEIIKLAPVIRRCMKQELPYRLVHTGQHYDHALDGIFFKELSIPVPTINLAAASPDQGTFFGRAFQGLEQSLRVTPSCLIVQGDTNSAFAGAFMGQRLGIPVVHLEAGLRSDDWTMPEEVNRILIDRISDRLYVPTEAQAERLFTEGIPKDRVMVTGNTVADAVEEHLALAKNEVLPAEFKTDEPYALITLHRPALVNDSARLAVVLGAVDRVLKSHGIRGIFLVHPRTRATLSSRIFESIVLVEPIGYLPMLKLLTGAKIVVTDSGGLQEETALLHIPCVTVRENTERPETVEAGGNVIAGFNPKKIAECMEQKLSEEISWKPLYSKKNAADAIVKDLVSRYL